MNWGTFLGVAGFVATVAFGIWGVYLVYKAQKYPGEVSFVGEQDIYIFDEIARNIPGLTVFYDGKQIVEDVPLKQITGAFINTGWKDIAPSMIEEFEIRLPSGCKWLGMRTLERSPSLGINFEIINDATMSLKLTNLFRRKEFVRFQALAEVPRSVKEPLEFKIRVQDTENTVPRLVLEGTAAPTWNLALAAGMIVMVAGLSWFFIYRNILDFREFAYPFRTAKSERVIVIARPSGPARVIVRGLKSNYREELSLDEFVSRVEWKPIVSNSAEGSWVERLTLAPLMVITGFIVVLIMALRQYRDQRRLRVALSSVKLDSSDTELHSPLDS